MDVLRTQTNWTSTVQQVYTLALDDLKDAANGDKLRHAFLNPRLFKPTNTCQLVTEQATQTLPILPSAYGNAVTTRNKLRISPAVLFSACLPRMWSFCRAECSNG
ncbi:MAG: hypothetical protein ACU0FH_08890 [Heliomarina sp.]|uniref:hypothetical protein n=1 Tax=Heliomarina sp. TaxID=2917556 RepID=UPI004057E502